MKIGFFKKPTIIPGLDIGTRCVKLACLEQRADGYRLIFFGIEELHPDAILAGEIRDRDQVIQAIQNLVAQSDLPLKDVIVSLSGNEILSEIVTIGSEFEGRSESIIREEAERTNPFDFDIGSVTLDYKTLEKDPQADRLQVLRIAARNEVIYNKYIDILTGAHLRPVILDVDFGALINTFSVNYDPRSFETVALVNIGSESTSIIFLGDGIFRLARELPIGVRAFVGEIQREMKIKLEEAERLLRDVIDGDSQDTTMLETIERVGQDLSKEIDIAISFFQSSTDYKSLEALFLSGGGAVIPGLSDLLERLTGVTTKTMNPLAGIKYDFSLFGQQAVEKVSPLLAVAIGLALRRIK